MVAHGLLDGGAVAKFLGSTQLLQSCVYPRLRSSDSTLVHVGVSSLGPREPPVELLRGFDARGLHSRFQTKGEPRDDLELTPRG